jgi:hypothetical protein
MESHLRESTERRGKEEREKKQIKFQIDHNQVWYILVRAIREKIKALIGSVGARVKKGTPVDKDKTLSQFETYLLHSFTDFLLFFYYSFTLCSFFPSSFTSLSYETGQKQKWLKLPDHQSFSPSPLSYLFAFLFFDPTQKARSNYGTKTGMAKVTG